jgi:hypothetical protein
MRGAFRSRRYGRKGMTTGAHPGRLVRPRPRADDRPVRQSGAAGEGLRSSSGSIQFIHCGAHFLDQVTQPPSLGLCFGGVETATPAVEGLGKITVTYKEDGTTIDQVESDGGRTVGLKVTAMFQELLDVIRPAGVTLTF